MTASGPLVKFRQGYGVKDRRDGWLSLDWSTMFLYIGDGKEAHQIVCDGPELDKVPTQGSTNGVESNGIYNALMTKQDLLYPGTGIRIDGNIISSDIVVPEVDIHSDDGSIRCTNDGSSWNIECLSPDIIAYLNDLCNWHYIYSASAPTINITYPTTRGTGTANLTCKRYRGLDPEHNTEAKAIAVEIVSSETSSTGWVKSNAKTYTYEYMWNDLALNSVTIPFKADMTSVYETTGSASCNLVINFIKPWFIIEGATAPSADTVNNAIDNKDLTNKWDLANSSYANGKEISFVNKVDNRYFYICAPSNKNVTFEQIAGSVLDAGTSTVSTKLGNYKIYKSKNMQNANDPIKGNITIK